MITLREPSFDRIARIGENDIFEEERHDEPKREGWSDTEETFNDYIFDKEGTSDTEVTGAEEESVVSTNEEVEEGGYEEFEEEDEEIGENQEEEEYHEYPDIHENQDIHEDQNIHENQNESLYDENCRFCQESEFLSEYEKNGFRIDGDPLGREGVYWISRPTDGYIPPSTIPPLFLIELSNNDLWKMYMEAFSLNDDDIQWGRFPSCFSPNVFFQEVYRLRAFYYGPEIVPHIYHKVTIRRNIFDCHPQFLVH